MQCVMYHFHSRLHIFTCALFISNNEWMPLQAGIMRIAHVIKACTIYCTTAAWPPGFASKCHDAKLIIEILKFICIENIIITSAYHNVTKYQRSNAELICAKLRCFYVNKYQSKFFKQSLQLCIRARNREVFWW